MIMGYARVSTIGQNLNSQKDKLKEYGCEKIFEEKFTGSDRKRVQLEKMLQKIDDGDTLIITRLDRLARSAVDLFDIVKEIEEKGASFKSLNEPWADTTSSMGKFLTTVFSGLSELERSIINERTEEGRIAARKRGVKFGRKFKLTKHQQDEVREMLKAGRSIRV